MGPTTYYTHPSPSPAGQPEPEAALGRRTVNQILEGLAQHQRDRVAIDLAIAHVTAGTRLREQGGHREIIFATAVE